MYISSDNYLAENLEKLGQNSQREPEHDVSAAFHKFAVVTKELSSMMKSLVRSHYCRLRYYFHCVFAKCRYIISYRISKFI